MPPVPPDEPTAGEQRVVPTAPSDVVLGRYLDGGCSAVERRVVEAWAAADPSHGAMLEALRLAWFDGLTGRDGRIAAWRATWDADRAWQQLLAVRDGSQREGAERTPRRAVDPRAAASEGSGFPRPWPRWGGVRGHSFTTRAWPLIGAFAAGVCAALGVAITRARLATPPSETLSREYATRAGQRETVRLADGTQFTLAPASRLRVPVYYGTRGRDVYLDGEAYFAVRHDAARPFRVHAGGVLAQDLGTAFVMRSYAGEAAVRVVVAEGRVSLGDTAARQQQRLVLPRGTLGEVDRAGVTHVTPGVNPDNYVAWTRGELRFSGTPLRDVLAELGRWYDLDVRVDDVVLGQRPVIASFPDEPSDDVFTSLAAGFGVRWQREGRAVVFTVANP